MYKAIRYIGSKQKLMGFLNDNLFCNLQPNSNFFEGFAGTGIVSQFITENYSNINISGSDLSLYSEKIFNFLNIGSLELKDSLITKFMAEFYNKEKIEGDIFNEFSVNGKPYSYSVSRNFFHYESGKTIDTYKLLLKEYIANNTITPEQANIFLAYLIAYTCKVANTTSVFGAYLKSEPKHIPLNIDFILNINNNLKKISEKKSYSSFYLGDILQNLKSIPEQSLIYLDPPYSTRRYETNYHILNYVADLNFDKSMIKKDSKTGQLNKELTNPFGRKKETEWIFENMIKESMKKTNLLGISYNTDGVIKQKWIEDLCAKEGFYLETRKMDYKRFKSNNENNNTEQLEEIIWIIRK